jgi:putative transposase
VAERRLFVQFARRHGFSTSAACKLVKVSRRRLCYISRRRDDELVVRLKELAGSHPRYGGRRLWALLRREGRRVNLKRVGRLCRQHGLLLKARRRRKRRGIGAGLPCKAEHPNQVWAYDFLEDRTETGKKLRILTIEDEFTRECVGIEVEHRMNARFVANTLLKLFEKRGTPAYVRSDNGPEFIARHLMRVLASQGVSARHIEPGSPWQNGINERFNGSLRDECLNMEMFHNRDHARVICQTYARQYNQDRPHSSLGYRTPVEFRARWEREGVEKDGCAGGGDVRLSHYAPPAGGEEAKGGSTTGRVRSASRKAIHVGAPVARQQSRILRVDRSNVTGGKRAGKVPAQNR